jgi:hypothetical protein
VVILTSVVGQFSRNLVAPGSKLAVYINGVIPTWSQHLIGTCFQQELNKVEVGHVVGSMTVQGRTAILIVTATLAPCSMSCFVG